MTEPSDELIARTLARVEAEYNKTHPAPSDGEAKAEAGEPNTWDRGTRPWTLAQWLQWANDNGATLTMTQMLDDWQSSVVAAPGEGVRERLIETVFRVSSEQEEGQDDPALFAGAVVDAILADLHPEGTP